MAIIEERINSKGEKSYRAKVRLKGYPVQTATFPRKTDAKLWAQQTEVDIRQGRYFVHTSSKTKILDDLIDRYIQEILPLKKASTAKDQMQQLSYWKQSIGHLRIEEVTPSVLVACRNELSKGQTNRGGKRSNATVNRYMAALCHAFSIAIREWEWVHDNPCVKISKLKETRGRTRYLNEQEMKRLLEACRRSESQHLYDVVVLALSSGARKSEILNLKWQDVDFDRQVFVVRESKNGEERIVPLQGHALERLEVKYESREFSSPYVFASELDGQPSCICTAWRTAIKMAGIKDFRFHDLRHTAASYFAMNGATITDIAEILGHKTLHVTKRYTHLHIDHTKKVVAGMNNKIGAVPDNY